MATPRKKRGPGTPLREERNTDPHWTNWDYLAAFGEDEQGYTYLEAIKRFCCLPSDEEAWIDDLVREAHRAYLRAGACQKGQAAAWRVLRRAGMILLHDLMADLRVGAGRLKPRAAFRWPTTTATTIIVATNWKPQIQHRAGSP